VFRISHYRIKSHTVKVPVSVLTYILILVLITLSEV